MHFRWFARHFVSLIFQSWFKNRRFKWRKEAREGSHTSPAALPAPAQGISLMYQPRYVYSSGQFPVSAQCQGCFTRQPSSDSHSHVDFTPYPYSSHWPTVKYLRIFALYIYMYIYKFSLCLRHSWRRAGEEGKRRRSWSQEIDHNYFSYARAKEISFFFPFFSFSFFCFFCFSSQRLVFRSAPKWRKGVNQPSLPPLLTPMN